MRISWPGVIIGAILMVALRYLWYAHFAGADWDHLARKAMDAMAADRDNLLPEAGIALVLSSALGWLIGQLREQSIIAGVAAGIIACAGFSLTTLYAERIHGGAHGDLLVDAGYMFAAFALAGAVLGAMAPKR